jgi:hypothetical protein
MIQRRIEERSWNIKCEGMAKGTFVAWLVAGFVVGRIKKFKGISSI